MTADRKSGIASQVAEEVRPEVTLTVTADRKRKLIAVTADRKSGR